MRIPVHPSSGTSRASVGQLAAQGMSTHITQAVKFTSSAGVPAASPVLVPSGWMA